MQFSNPSALWLLALLIPFIFLAIASSRLRNRWLAEFFSSRARSKMVVRGGRELDVFKTLLLTLSLGFLILALAGPEWGERYEPLEVRGTEMVFLLDTSRSMAAADLRPSRLESARQLIIMAADTLATDYVSLIHFAGRAVVQCPLTVDYEAFKLMVLASEISPAEEQGTNLAAALDLAIKMLDTQDTAQRVMVLITDGEDQEGGWQERASQLKERGIVVFAVGVGAPEGAPIPLRSENGEVTDWKRDQQGRMVRTRLDEEPLKHLARETGGRYFRLLDPGDTDHFVTVLKTFERRIIQRKVRRVRVPRFQYPLGVGIILLFLEMALTTRRIRWTAD
ncbi:MAG TPA: VWA domain-containing protein [Candidatus Aminicenantes bacterium]|nr:VWA domain-containing protein [Candidatus Aminicenantes bacterium]